MAKSLIETASESGFRIQKLTEDLVLVYEIQSGMLFCTGTPERVQQQIVTRGRNENVKVGRGSSI